MFTMSDTCKECIFHYPLNTPWQCELERHPDTCGDAKLMAPEPNKEHGRAHPGPMRKPKCLCGAIGIRDEKFDAYYCPTSGVWLEDKCDEPGCIFKCKDRPEIHT